MSNLVIFLIKFYRKFISPYTKPRCRFSPTCSAYALESFRKFGFFLGVYLTVKRLLKCHPFYKGNYFDNVPLFKEDIFRSNKEKLQSYPLAISGLFLSLLTLGNILQVYASFIRWFIGVVVFLFYSIYILKLIFCFSDVKKAVDGNALVASSFPVIAMASVVLSSYINFFSSFLANVLWYGALLFYIFYIPYFTIKYVRNFKITNVFASWYIVYVGIAILGIFSKVSYNYILGQGTFWFGLLSFLLLLPIILYRIIRYPNITDIQRPSLIVLAAPASLLFLSYYFSVYEKNSLMLIFLFSLSILFYVVSLFFLPKILKQNFYPTISSTTFPMVTGAFVSKLMAEYFFSYKVVFDILYFIQLVIAVFVVIFSSISYIKNIYMKNKFKS